MKYGFLGTGSAFNYKLKNSSMFFYTEDKTLIFLDCGTLSFKGIIELDYLNEAEKIIILLSHTHPDHAGALGSLVLHCKEVLNIKPEIYFPEKELIVSLLDSQLITGEKYILRAFSSGIIPLANGILKATVFPNSHEPGTNYGWLLTFDEKTIYYSGDTHNLNQQAYELLCNNQIDCFYQDTSKEGTKHLSLAKLSEMVPQELRNKVFCMHRDKALSKGDIKALGFNIARRCKK